MSDDSNSSSEEKSYKSSLFVRNLPENIESEDIRTLCSKYAEVKDIYIPIDFHSGKRKGFAFIELFTAKEALKVLEKINGKEIKGSKLSVMVAKQGRKTSSEMKKKERRVKKRFSASKDRGSSEEHKKKYRKVRRSPLPKSRKHKKRRTPSSSPSCSNSRSRSRSNRSRNHKVSRSKSGSKKHNETKSSKSNSPSLSQKNVIETKKRKKIIKKRSKSSSSSKKSSSPASKHSSSSKSSSSRSVSREKKKENDDNSLKNDISENSSVD